MKRLSEVPEQNFGATVKTPRAVQRVCRRLPALPLAYRFATACRKNGVVVNADNRLSKCRLFLQNRAEISFFGAHFGDQAAAFCRANGALPGRSRSCA